MACGGKRQDDRLLCCRLYSEAYEAVKARRRAIGVELKDSYFKQAIENVASAIIERDSPNLFDTPSAKELLHHAK